MTVSDFIWSYLADAGVGHVFYLPGGGSQHLVDALARQDRIEPVVMLDERHCSIAAAAYAMYKNDLGVCCVTTGPGGTNAVTGCAAAFIDYVPLVVISGQVPTHLMKTEGERQRGPQEVDIVSIVKSITKYAVTAVNTYYAASRIDLLSQNALNYPRGPVWLDVPLDVQGAAIE